MSRLTRHAHKHSQEEAAREYTYLRMIADERWSSGSAALRHPFRLSSVAPLSSDGQSKV